MSLIAQKKIYHINSGTQLTGLNSTFSVPISLPDGNDYDRICVLSANIPVSYYTIQTGFNTFVLYEDGINTTITVTPGNYNIASFCQVVQNLLNQYSPHVFRYDLSYPQNYKDTNTGKINYSCTVDIGINHTIGFRFSDNNSIFQQFGFSRGSIVYFSYDTGLEFSLVSTNVVSFIPESSIYLHSNLVDGKDTPSSSFSSCLQEMYNENNTIFGVLSWTNPAPIENSRAFVRTGIQLASFSLTDEFGSPIYMNGLDIVITLMIFKLNDIYSKIGNFIDNFNTYNVEGILNHLIQTQDRIVSALEKIVNKDSRETVEQPVEQQPVEQPVEQQPVEQPPTSVPPVEQAELRDDTIEKDADELFN
jgi:hypothetical protein